MIKRDAIKTPFARIVNTPRITFILLLITALASLGIDIAYVVSYGFDPTAVSLVFLAAACLSLLWVHHKGRDRLAGFILYLIVSGVLTYNISIGDAIYDEAMIAYPIIIVFTGLLFGKRSLFLVTGLTVAQVIVVYFLSLAGFVQPFDGGYTMKLDETITTLVILLVTGAILWVVVNLIERTVQRILQSENDLENAYDLTLEAWAQALELRGREVKGHSQRVTRLTVKLARRLGYDQEALRQIRRGARLHDIGKMGILEKILLKPGPLTDEEWAVVSKHTLTGVEILKDIPDLQAAAEVVCCHHEHMDGGGYPNKLRGEEIPEAARIFAVADTWDMLRSDRPYGKAWTDEEALAHLQSEAGKIYDPRIVEAFATLLEEEAQGEDR
jgi:putative nucleotidyltransferase with HDIG domain